MEMNQDKLAQVEVFKLQPGDIDHLFRRSGVAGNKLSVFQYNAEQAAVSSPSPWFKALAESPLCRKIGRNLLEPDVRISFHTGGNNAAEDKYHAMLTREDNTVLAQFINAEGQLLLLYFPDGESFIQWWAGIYAAAGMEKYPVVFDGALETEVLICALHCVDIYRRFYLESMLDYRGLVDLSITTADFVQLLKKSLASADKRWLLPTLFEITPGLRRSNIALKPGHLKKLEELGFVSSQDSLLTLAERSRLMGTEFISSWMNATGWQATALIKGEEKSLSRVFLAATAFANHLFSFESLAGGESRFRHKAVTTRELTVNLLSWLEAVKKVTGDNAPPAPNTGKSAAKTKFCGQCGAEFKPGKKFCTSCGAPL
ncbi:MAG: zinc ribbon domain-containing protein [Syntrophomonadaceae bacterium]|nr:zinc ribbon domain-containing protein [Syntrophomonadaceae bacterium]